MSEAKVIVVANQKGGVGKTTTTVNLGAELTRQGKRVLLIDTDPQGDLSTSVGIKDIRKLKVTIKSLMEKVLQGIPIEKGEGILKSNEEIDIVPANIELGGLERALEKYPDKEKVLQKYINQIKDNYDYVLIDCKPSLGLLTVNALASADSVIIPVQTQFLPLKGMTELLQTINKTKVLINPKLRIDGILLTIADLKTKLTQITIDTIKGNYGGIVKIYNTIIPRGIKAAESTTEGKSVYAYDKLSKPALAYVEFAKEVLQNSEVVKTRRTKCR